MTVGFGIRVAKDSKLTTAEAHRLAMLATTNDRTNPEWANPSEWAPFVLEGRRTCERGTALVPFICGVMKSFVSQENEARKDGFRPTIVMRNGEPIVPDALAEDPSPERSAISAIDDRAVLAGIEAEAAGDEKLQLLIEGIYDELRGPELQELLGVDEKGLAAVRRKFRRLLQKTCSSEMAS